MAALEISSSRPLESVFSSANYSDLHALLIDLVRRSAATPQPSWTAHVLLSAVRADLLYHLVHVDGMSARQIRSRLRGFVRSTLLAP